MKINTKTAFKRLLSVVVLALIMFFTFQGAPPDSKTISVKKGCRIVLIGNNLASRMMNYGHFETEMHLRYPDSMLFIRNMADGGNTAGFRPHASRKSPWAFPGAERFQTELATNSSSMGHFPTEDGWLTMLKPDVILAFFGYNESFKGTEGLENFKAELDAFVKYTLTKKYNSVAPPQLALVSPIAFENLSAKKDLPNGVKENVNLELYTKAMKEIAAKNKVLFIDTFTPTSKWFQSKNEDLTIDGSQLTDEGYAKFSVLLADQVFGKKTAIAKSNRELVRNAVLEKNWMWHNDIKMPNGVHAYGRRYDPFGPENYPAEVAKIREMTAIRDQAIWQAAKGKKMDVAAADEQTSLLPKIETNYKQSGKNGTLEYLYGKNALDKFHVAPGYKIELFASEVEFPDLANPVQMTFDTKGRLWVATMPTYPHWKPGDPKPNDKILIFEDTNNDGKADKQTVFADGLHLPIGFSFAPEGVYVSQGTNLVLLTDTNSDDKADVKKIILSGFDDHDTHHAHSTYTMDPSGAIYMGEGVFLHSNIETSYGPVRATNGGFFRYTPQLNYLERVAQLSIPNPWGIAFDDWGQTIFAETSSPSVRWMLPGTIKPRYGEVVNKGLELVEEKHKVRPTSGLEFVSSRHFPDEVQGDYLINNTIGFLGAKQHTLTEDGTGFKSKHRQDLFWSDDKNFRPVDLEFAPDGSLYLIDWHNVLIGHMQHNARDPLRDHVHGRIYRITYPSRPLIKPAKISGASIEVLLDNLKLPEYGSRYRTRIELRARKASEVLPRIKTWIAKLDKKDPKYEHHVLEALWVTWGLNKIDRDLLKMMLNAKDYRARAAAVHVVRYMGHQLPDQSDLLLAAAKDEHGRVRLEAITAASWLGKEKGMPVVMEAGKKALDQWIAPAYEAALAHLNGTSVKVVKKPQNQIALKGADKALYIKGKAIFLQDGFCGTCHQEDGKGVEMAGFPPLVKTRWVEGSVDRLIKLTLKGLHGPIEVHGKKYPGQVPMTPFGGMLSDEEVAAVLTYIRNSFGNNASAVYPAKVKDIRAKISSKTDFYAPEALLKEHPLEKK